MAKMPAVRPAVPHFSSGPCAKRPGWSLQALTDAVLGRSHRSKAGKAKLKRAIDLTREVLEVPADYRIGIVPASDTGAVEMALWSLLGPRRVTMLAWESFGEGWVADVQKELKLKDVTVIKAPYGDLPDLSKVDPATDVVFTWNGTTSGVRVPNADWIAADRAGLTICDATSAAFAQALEWPKLDVVTFSWQKALGGEAAHGMLILSPRAVARLESHTPAWPIPKIFRLTKGGKVNEDPFEGGTINTPSMLCVEDYLDTLTWAKSVGGLKALMARADANAKVIADWVARHAVDRISRQRSGLTFQYLGLPQSRRSGGAQAFRRRAKQIHQGHFRDAREGGRRLRHRRLSRRAVGPTHLVRLDRRARRCRGAYAVARLGLRTGEGSAGESGVTLLPSPGGRQKSPSS